MSLRDAKTAEAARPTQVIELQGRRVYLRPARPSDRDEYLELNRRSRRFHRRWVCAPTDAQMFAAYLDRCRRRDFVGLLVCRRDDGAILGAVELSQIVHGALKSAYLGYHLGAPYARQGYMTEALRLVIRHAFRELKLHRLEANIQPGNHASIALVRRLGFTREGYSRRYLKIAGRWRDHERWAILAD